MRKIEKYAISHVPHLNHVLALLWANLMTDIQYYLISNVFNVHVMHVIKHLLSRSLDNNVTTLQSTWIFHISLGFAS